MPRLPIPGSDEGNWGRILNDYLLTTHAEDGTLKPGTITSASLSAGAITTTALADGIVSEAKLDATVRTKLNSTSGTSVAGLLGQPNGIATLDASGKVPASQLPTSSGGTTPDATANSKGSIQLTGDLGGSATSPRVMGLNGITVSGTPTPGQVLTASSSSTAAWSTNAQTGGMLWTSSTAPTTQEGAADGDLWTDAATDPVHLRVRVNGQWVSLASVPKPSGGTINPAPGTPNGTPSDTSIILNWTAPANPGGTVSGYNVYDAQGTKLNSTPLTATSYTVTGLTAGTSYSFTIRSIVNGTEASQGATVSVTTTGGGGGTTVPTAPTNVTATAGDGQASVTFTPVSGATSYTVTASSGQTQTGTSSPITVTGLTNGTAVTFTVTASNSAGTSPASAASGAVTPEGGGGTPSNDVTGLTVTPAETSAVVSWVAPTNPTGSIEGYNVYQGSTKQNTSVVPTSPYTVTGLTADTDYTFTVKTVVAGAESTGVSVGGRTTGGGGGNIPAKLVGAYHNQFFEPVLSTVEAEAPQYNLNLVSSALGAGGGNVTFSPSQQSPASFKSDMQISQAKGDKWLISVFGNGNFNLRTTEQADQLVAAIKGIANEYGFDGVDLNLEGNSDRTTPDQWEWLPDAAADFCQKIKTEMGQNFIVSAAPRPWEDYQREFAVKAGNNLDLFGYQFYDIPELADDTYLKNHMMERVDQTVAAGIPASKVLLGARIDSENGNHGSLQGYIDGWNEIEAKYPNIRGVYIWDTQLDQSTGWQFAQGMATAVLKQ
jgi:chitinase